MNETINTLLARRSVRNYKPDQVSDELLDIVLNAGQHATSGMNNQKAILVAVRDSDQTKQQCHKQRVSGQTEITTGEQ